MTQAAPVDADLLAKFPILGESVFFNHAAVAPISGPAAEALRTYAHEAARVGYLDATWYKRVEAVRAAAARIIGARGPHEIAFVPNTSTGLVQVAEGLRWAPGDSVVISDVEYPANRYPWENLRRLGVEVIEVHQHPDGRIDVDEVIDAIRDRTRVVSLSHVQFASGFRIQLEPIAEVIHQVGGYLCVDAIQSVGVMPVDVQALGVDFLSADGHKWMLGPEGLGFFYCHEELIEGLRPAVVGWMNVVNPSDYLNYRFEFQKTAKRFEPGTYNIAGTLALGASLDLLLEVGLDNVWARVEALNARLCEGLGERGYRVFSPRLAGERSGSVTFDPPPGGPDPEAVVKALRQKHITIALRGGRLRASPHFYNTPDQVDRLLDALPRI